MTASTIPVKNAQGVDVSLASDLVDGVHTPKHIVASSALPTGAATEAKQDAVKTAVDAVAAKLIAAPATAAGQAAHGVLLGAVDETAPAADVAASGINGRLQRIAQRLSSILTAIQGALSTFRPPLTYTQVAGSPFTLTSAWAKVATTTTATRGLRLAPIASASVYDIEWVSVTAGAAAPTDVYGEPVLGGEDFPAGLPIGDIYCKSASGQKLIVKTGV